MAASGENSARWRAWSTSKRDPAFARGIGLDYTFAHRSWPAASIDGSGGARELQSFEIATPGKDAARRIPASQQTVRSEPSEHRLARFLDGFLAARA